MSAILDALGYIGESLDKPGAALRGLLAGRPDQLMNLVPFSDTMGLTNPEERTSGRGLLEAMGLLGANEEGLDFGDMAGFGTEMLLDPLNLIGGGLVKKAFGANKLARTSNARRAMMLEKGAMPEEIAKLTKAVDETGQPLRTYHGTASVFNEPSMAMAAPRTTDFYQHPVGYYTTTYPEHAGVYAEQAQQLGRGNAQQTRMQLLDARNPIVFTDYAEPELVGWQMQRAPATESELMYKSLAREFDAEQATREMTARGYDSAKFIMPESYPGGAEWVAFDPSQVYAPWVAPAMQQERRLSPLLAAMAGEQGLARTSGRYRE